MFNRALNMPLKRAHADQIISKEIVLVLKGRHAKEKPVVTSTYNFRLMLNRTE